MTLATMIIFGHLYLPNSYIPAYTFPSSKLREGDFGYVMTTKEWKHLCLSHTMTNYVTSWSTGETRMAATRYEVELRLRSGDVMFTVGHESWHNSDVNGPGQSYNRIGIELFGR